MQKNSSENGTARSNTFIVPACIIVGATLFVILDRILKWVALTQWTDQRIELLPGVQFTFLLNKGIALSIPLTGTAGLALILMLFLVLMIWFVLLIRNAQWLRASIVCVVLLGAGSNIVDRLLYDGVVDYLQVVFPSVINLADVMVMAGIAGLLVVPKHDSAQTRFAPTREN